MKENINGITAINDDELSEVSGGIGAKVADTPFTVKFIGKLNNADSKLNMGNAGGIGTDSVVKVQGKQLMNIACRGCGEIITADVSKPSAICPKCGVENQFFG